MIVVTISKQAFIHDPPTTTSNKETLIQNFLEISRKPEVMLPRKRLFGTTCIVMYV